MFSEATVDGGRSAVKHEKDLLRGHGPLQPQRQSLRNKRDQ